MNAPIEFVILLCAVITIVIRVSPVMFLSRFGLPRVVQDWLGFVPGAIMAALIATELFLESEALPRHSYVPWVSGLIAALCGIISRSLFCTVIAGVLAYLAQQFLL